MDLRDKKTGKKTKKGGRDAFGILTGPLFLVFSPHFLIIAGPYKQTFTELLGLPIRPPKGLGHLFWVPMALKTLFKAKKILETI